MKGTEELKKSLVQNFLNQTFLLTIKTFLLSVVTCVEQLPEYDSKTSDIVSFLFRFVR